MIRFRRLPVDDDELHGAVAALWGIAFPRTAVCPGHVAPFQLFADAFFGRHPVMVIKASRGLAGKSLLLCTLGLTRGVLRAATATVLGGSRDQSHAVTRYARQLLSWPDAPRDMLTSRLETIQEITMRNGAWMRALKASQTSVRGSHPTDLLLDECDEMDMSILEAAQGQPMSRTDLDSITVMSSTHQYPEGTFSTVLVRAAEAGWPVYQWCYEETAEPHGWLSHAQIERKRGEIAERMWNVEYMLGEPTITDRAIDTDAVKRTFDVSEQIRDEPGREYVFEGVVGAPARYVTSADWAQTTDWTVIQTWRVDCTPMRLVAYLRIQRRPWPEMIGHFNERLRTYGGTGVHDATGIGGVVDDYVTTGGVVPIILVGKVRKDIFSEWIAAIERDEARAPRLEAMFREHLYCAASDLFTTGGHPPDTFVAAALANHMVSAGRVQLAQLADTRRVTGDRDPAAVDEPSTSYHGRLVIDEVP